MTFDELCGRIRERLRLPLPGQKAHNVFLARPVGNLRPRLRFSQSPRLSGVIILLYEDDGGIRFPLIKRPDYPGTHGGQVSLPGGKAEPGEDAIQAALRECEEEIGIERKDITVLGSLSEFYVTASNYMVTPVVASIHHKPVFVPDPFEVSRVLEVGLDDVTGDDAIKEKEILAGGKYRMIAPHFEINEEVVWGATAMMLNEFRVVLEEVG